jgi:hypothetical protein
MRVLDLGSPESPPANQYEVASEVELILTSQAVAGPSQAARASGQQKTDRVLEREKTLVPEKTRSSQVRRKSMECSTRSGRTQSPVLDMAKTPKRTKTPNRGKGHVAQALQPPAHDCMIVEQWRHPPFHTITAWERRSTPTLCGRNKLSLAESDHSPNHSVCKKKQKVPTMEHSGSEDGL